VIYNPFSPNTVYRVTDGSAGNAAVRRSDDGGLTWQPVANGFQAYPFGGGFYVVPLAMDPSRPNRLFSGYSHVVATDDNGDNWRQAVQVSTTGTTTAIPDMPTYVVTRNGGGPIGLTAIGTGRETGVAFLGPGGFSGLNGSTLFVGTEFDAARDATTGNP